MLFFSERKNDFFEGLFDKNKLSLHPQTDLENI